MNWQSVLECSPIHSPFWFGAHTQGSGRVLKKTVFWGKQSFRQVIPKSLVLCVGFSLSTKNEGPGSCFFSHIPIFRKETLKKQEYSAGIRPEDAWASLEKPSFACSLGSAFHTSIRRCMRICMTILHSSFHWRCDVFLSQEFPPFVKLFQTSRVGW